MVTATCARSRAMAIGRVRIYQVEKTSSPLYLSCFWQTEKRRLLSSSAASLLSFIAQLAWLLTFITVVYTFCF